MKHRKKAGNVSREALCWLGGILGQALIFSLIFQLRWQWCLTAVILSALFVPGLLKNHRSCRREQERFYQVNAYMSQMAQSFTSTGNILLSLKETRNTFVKGEMRELLAKAVSQIENACDTRLAEGEALALLEETYDCERIHTLHDFLQKAEQRGGSCENEFRLLETIRQIWERSVQDYRHTIRVSRNMIGIEYGALMLVCAFMLSQFPRELLIPSTLIVQILNTGMIVCFVAVFRHMDKKLSESMLKDEKRMSREQADKNLCYLESFSGKKAVLKNLPLTAGAVVFSIICTWYGKNGGFLAAGVLAGSALLFQNHFRWRYLKGKLQKEIKKEFPKWLFDVLLLLQRENVQVSIFKSVETAAPVLQRELERMKLELQENPSEAQGFMNFMRDFQIPQIESAMRKLYSLNVGTGEKGEVVNVIIDTNMRWLAELEKKQLKMKGEMFSAYYMVPAIPVVLCMMGYGAALMIKIFGAVMELI